MPKTKRPKPTKREKPSKTQHEASKQNLKKELAALNKLKQQIAKDQKKKNKQAIKRTLGVWPPPPPNYPHKSRSFAMDVFIGKKYFTVIHRFSGQIGVS